VCRDQRLQCFLESSGTVNAVLHLLVDDYRILLGQVGGQAGHQLPGQRIGQPVEIAEIDAVGLHARIHRFDIGVGDPVVCLLEQAGFQGNLGAPRIHLPVGIEAEITHDANLYIGDSRQQRIQVNRVH